jgi:hypothetical protein
VLRRKMDERTLGRTVTVGLLGTVIVFEAVP